MTDEVTCGKGLAANAPLFAALGELAGSVADILLAHLPSLDERDENSRREGEVYRALVDEQRRAAEQLASVARRMAGAHDLPMGRHDDDVMGSAAVAESFRRFVRAEEALADLIRVRLDDDREMLSALED